MGFSNPIIGGGGGLVYPSIHSPNYVPGVSGWSIDKNGDAEFSDIIVRGTYQGTDFVINTAGAFFYDGAPAAGNLIASIAPAAGTDQFGNEYPQGIGGTTAADYASLLQTATPNAALVYGLLGQPYDVDLYRYDDTVTKWLRTSRSIRADVQMTTPVITALVGGTPETWNTITPDTGWTAPGGTTGQAPQYRLLADGSVQVKGLLTRSAIGTGGVNVNSGAPLPAAYQPAAPVYYHAADLNRAGVLVKQTGVLEAFGVAGGSTSVDLAGTYWPGS